jgi:peptidoglycan/LPS O-acetylase OafA/YrhL
MIFLDQVAQGRDNNFNLIRFVAAFAVLVSHAFPIALGEGAAEPLEALFGRSLGSVAVFVFFAVSGFLIAASFARARSPGAFWQARALRILPCLVVSTLLVGLVMGPLVTTLPPAAYLADPATWTFLLRNILMALPQYTLPGVFESNPYPTVLGSIWTLIHEVGCYAMLFAVGILGLLRPRLFGLVLMAYAAVWAVTLGAGIPLHGKLEQFRLLALPFLAGMALHVWRDRIPMSGLLALGLIALAAALRATPLYTLAFTLALAYATFWCAFVPRGLVRAYNRVGDYSYGLYLYAFPVQGLAVWLWGPLTPLGNVVLAFPLTLALAILSWHWVEAPALRLRGRRRRPAAAG